MKQIKFLMMALMVMTSFVMTSCLDSDGDGESSYAHFVRVNSSSFYCATTFVDGNGTILYPTTTSLASTGYSTDESTWSADFLYITYVLAENTSSTQSSYNIELKGYVVCDGDPVQLCNSAEIESICTNEAPICALTDSYYNYPFMFDKSILYMPIYYRYSGTATDVEQHTMTLACNMEEITSDSKELVFYLCHDAGTDKSTSSGAVNNYGYNIAQAVSRFSTIVGEEPTTIVVKVKENEYSTELPETYTVYKANYLASAIFSKQYN